MTLNIGWDKQDADLDSKIIDILVNKFNFDKMMPVQKACVPLFCKNYDCAVEAQTGSGKTQAFLLPIINQILKNPVSNPQEVRAIIISPTRELAQQTNHVLEVFTSSLSDLITNLCLIGGVNKSTTNNTTLHENIGRNIIIATPGRLKEVLEKKIPNFEQFLKEFHYQVLDEADRLIENNFYEDIKNIIISQPKQRRTGLFSATLSSAKMTELIKLGLRNPISQKLSKKTLAAKQQQQQQQQNTEQNESDAKQIEHDFIKVPDKLKNYYKICEGRLEKILVMIGHIIQNHKKSKTIVFFNTCSSVTFYHNLIAEYFTKNGQGQISKSLFQIHGGMKQDKRLKSFRDFGDSKYGVIFATDVIARGIDFPAIDWIMQIDPPQDPMFYIHRIGRTARSGSEGSAILLLLDSEKGYLDYQRARGVDNGEMNDESVMIFKGKDKKRENFMKNIKEVLFADKDFIVKASKAFVSFIRSYKEHKLMSIFNFKDLDPVEIAKSFFLLKIPKIEEQRKWDGDWKIGNEEELKLLDELEFRDQNKKKQYSEKEEIVLKKREKEEAFKQAKRDKAEKEHKKKKVRSHVSFLCIKNHRQKERGPRTGLQKITRMS